jgi:hypothetical protein
MPSAAVPLMLTLVLASSLALAAKPRQFIDEAEPAAPASIVDPKPWEEGKTDAAALAQGRRSGGIQTG